jgi:transcriptional regulator with XRE-family HTH domain
MAKIKEEKIAAIVARNIKTLRAVRGFSQKQLQERGGWQQQSFVWQLENGKIGVGPQTLAKLADALLVDPGMIFMESLPDNGLGIEQLAKIDLKNIGRILVNSIEHQGTESSFDYARIPLYYMQEVPPCDNVLPTEYFPLIKNDNALNVDNLVCVRVDTAWETPIGYSDGDVICLDRGDRSGDQRVYPRARTDQFVVRLGTGVDIYIVDGEGPSYNLINIEDVYDECGELPSNPISLDLRAYPDAIIGRVLWAVKSVANGLPPCRLVRSSLDEKCSCGEYEPSDAPDRLPREEEE